MGPGAYSFSYSLILGWTEMACQEQTFCLIWPVFLNIGKNVNMARLNCYGASLKCENGNDLV